MTQYLLPFTPTSHRQEVTGRYLRDKAISRANKAAGIVWTSRARDLFWQFCHDHETFMIEEARVWIEEQGLKAPFSKRIYGGIARYAAAQGWIERVGTGTVENVKAHACFAGKWKSRIYRG